MPMLTRAVIRRTVFDRCWLGHEQGTEGDTAGKQFLDGDAEHELRNTNAYRSGYTSNCVRQMLAGPRTRHRGGTLLVNNFWTAM